MSDTHIIDCDADPFVPEGWKAAEHRKGGQVIWDPTKFSFYLSRNQKTTPLIRGAALRRELRRYRTYNACLLDYLLAHPQLIPKDWQKDCKGNNRRIFFWGTIYQRPDGRHCVRFLSWAGGRWHSGRHSLRCTWDYQSPALVGMD